jgi:hypothetical protein
MISLQQKKGFPLIREYTCRTLKNLGKNKKKLKKTKKKKRKRKEDNEEY